MNRIARATLTLPAIAMLTACIVIPPFIPDEDAYIDELNAWTTAVYGMSVQQAAGIVAGDVDDPLQAIVDHGYRACTYDDPEVFADDWATGSDRAAREVMTVQWDAAHGNLCP